MAEAKRRCERNHKPEQIAEQRWLLICTVLTSDAHHPLKQSKENLECIANNQLLENTEMRMLHTNKIPADDEILAMRAASNADIRLTRRE